MRTLRLLLTALVAATGLMLVAPAPALACSCVGGTPQQFASWADVVFTGTLLERTPPPQREVMSSMDPATHLFEVDAVHLGEVGSQVEVLSAQWGASCGLEGMEEGTRYVVFAGYDDIEGKRTEALWANLCGGTAPASDRFVDSVVRATGPGLAPEQASPSPAAAGAAAAGGPQTGRRVDRTEAGLPAWAWGGGALVLLAGAAGLVARRRTS